MTSDPQNATHAQRALAILRQRILGGDLIGGQRLFEVALAADLGISRTPVRDALARLAAEGLLDRASGGGFLVRSFAVRDVIETIDLRGLLEGAAVRMAAERGVPVAQIAQARGVLVAIDAAFAGDSVDIDSYARLNAQFHALLAEMAQSDVIAREIARITALPFAAPSAFLDDPSQQATSARALAVTQAQHHAILDAVANREGARAEALMREHARAARRNAENLLSGQAGAAITLVTAP